MQNIILDFVVSLILLNVMIRAEMLCKSHEMRFENTTFPGCYVVTVWKYRKSSRHCQDMADLE